MNRIFKDANDWSSTPPKELTPSEYSIIRTPATGGIRGICLSPNVVGKVTHYWKGRTGPHLADNCPACLAGIRKAWHGWIMFYSKRTQNTSIFEFTAGAGVTVAKARSTYASLKGVHFAFERKPDRPNGRVVCAVLDVEKEKAWLPAAPDLVPILERIWNTSALGMVEYPTPQDIQNDVEDVNRYNEHLPPSSNGNGFLHHD